MNGITHESRIPHQTIVLCLGHGARMDPDHHQNMWNLNRTKNVRRKAGLAIQFSKSQLLPGLWLAEVSYSFLGDHNFIASFLIKDLEFKLLYHPQVNSLLKLSQDILLRPFLPILVLSKFRVFLNQV